MKRIFRESAESEMCECCNQKKEDCACEPDCECGCKKSQNESYGFDKFMDSILISENKRKTIKCASDSPQRERARRNQERPLGRTFFGR